MVKGLSAQFSNIADRVTQVLGSLPALGVAIALIVIWLVTGPIFNFSDTWQLVINTTTTIVTFIMIFVVQTSQNRDAKAVHIKLDEIIRVLSEARNEIMTVEHATEDELDKFQTEMKTESKR